VPNGCAVALPLELTSPSTPASPSIETTIGEATAAAVTMICRAMFDYQRTGGLPPAVKDAGGERIARVFELQQAYAGEIDFAATVRREGSRVLRQYLGAEFYQRYSADEGEAAINLYVDGLLEILVHVTAVERAFAN
jgi:hypothetical protein